MLKSLILFATISVFTSAQIVNYDVQGLNEELSDCIERAAEQLMEQTCVFLRQADQPQAVFIESTHCAWQEENNTVHLNAHCATDEVCFELLGRVLSVEQPKQHIARHVNIKYNCTERCTKECLNGGEVLDDCSCKCGYGFSGESCEKLTKASIFTDKNGCGIVEAHGTGEISLSTYPTPREKNTFCQWLIRSDDPWTVIDAEILDLGLDNIDVNPGTKCNDLFTVYGAQGISEPIPCDNSVNITKLHSTHNWLLLELRTNPWSEHSFSGPKIKYSTRKVQPGVRIFSEGMLSSSALLLPSSLFLVVSYLFC